MKSTLKSPNEAVREAAIQPAPSQVSIKRRPARILLAEDDDEMRRYLAEALRKAGYGVLEVRNGYGMLDFINRGLAGGSEFDFDAIISDIRMPGANGLRILSALHSHIPRIPVVLITGFGNAETHEEAKLRGAIAVLDKPFSFNELLAILHYELGRNNRSQQGTGRYEPYHDHE